MRSIFVPAAVLTVALTGCADFNVTPVTPINERSVQGVRYYLPKPFILAVPQPNGTVVMSVVYLPDSCKEYAIDSSSGWFSSYSFQVQTDPSGLLIAVQYGADTTAVGAQTAATAGAATAQMYNYRAAQSAAIQTQVNSAQGALITAQANYQAALAQLNADTQANAAAPTTLLQTAIGTDNGTVAQALAKLQVQQTALLQADATNQAATATASAGAPITPTAPSLGTLPAISWTAPSIQDLPERFGPVLYAIDAKVVGNVETVQLNAVTSRFNGRDEGADAVPPTEYQPSAAQQAFNTLIVQPPMIAVPAAAFKASQGFVPFLFSQIVYDVKAGIVSASGQPVVVTPPAPVKPTVPAPTPTAPTPTAPTPTAPTPTAPTPTAPTAKWDGAAQITVDVSNLPAGGYELVVTYTYAGSSDTTAPRLPAKQLVPFTITGP